MTLARDSGEPLFRQIFTGIRESIIEGRVAPGALLPSTRHLAADLGVARSTIIQAYEQLRAEGYVDGILGAGTRVALTLPDRHLRSQAPAGPSLVHRRSVHIAARARAILAAPRREHVFIGRPPRAFRAGVPAVDVFPVDVWGRLLSRRWTRATAGQLAYADARGHLPLREAVAEYLRAARGVRCTTDQVLIVNGSQQGIDLCARVLLDPGDQVWLEDPGYHGARGACVAAGGQVVPVPVDDEGLVVAEGRRRAPGARLAFVTPSRQLPLGVTMSTARRLELLEWAAAGGAWILEDDYDSEFRYATRPLSALQGLDAHGCVVYLGTFSKVMFPSLRLGYLVVPDALVEAFTAARHFMDYHSSWLDQAVMADFITEGHFERHIRRMRAIYQERQGVLLAAGREALGDVLHLAPTDAGMNLIGWLHDRSDVEAARAAACADIDVLALSPMAVQRQLRPGLLLGYSGIRAPDIEDGARRLADVLRRVPRRATPAGSVATT